MIRSNAMTIGRLSRQTGVPIKILRIYEGLGFLYTLGRTESNYRLFNDEAVWCVHLVQTLRSLGLTLKEIQDLIRIYVEHPDEPLDTLVDTQLTRAVTRVEARIADLQALRQRIRDFQAARAGTHAPSSELACLLAADPRRVAADPAESAS